MELLLGALLSPCRMLHGIRESEASGMSEERVREMTMKVMSEEHKLIMKEIITIKAQNEAILAYMKKVSILNFQDDGDRPVSTYEKEQVSAGTGPDHYGFPMGQSDGEKERSGSVDTGVKALSGKERPANSKPSETEKYEPIPIEKAIEHIDKFVAGTKEDIRKRNEAEEERLSETERFIITHEGRTYSRFKPCKYKCGMFVSFPDDYKKGDKPLHVNPITKEVLGGCPRYE
jgi:hypothetical protein